MDFTEIFRFSQLEIRYFFIGWIFVFNSVSCELEVKITDGILRGQVFQSRGGRAYYAYTSVPYAKPPIGELRFKAPEPVEPWNGTLDATKESNKCVQSVDSNSQEDCLYLNVYRPRVDKKFLPIMVWIHGGMFSEGYGWPSVQGPEFLMDKDLILVSMNYRLGVLGFISTEDDAIPGNYGMKDQVMALRWVRDNIAKFGGDPGQVTIAGASSGGACIGHHMLSPMSKGLFHKAILESGAPVCMWATAPPGLARKRAQSIATIAGCNYDTSEDILKCFKRLPAHYIVSLQSKLHAWLSHPAILFTPVVENCNSGQEAFLCHHPVYDFRQESFVPAIVGVNSAEGGIFVASLYNKTSMAHAELRTDFNRLLSIILHYNQYARPEDVDEIGERVLHEYFPSGSLDDDTHSNAINMLGDGGFIHCAVDMINKLSSPVYNYFYDYQNEVSFNKYFGPCEKPLGVTHADELTSIFALHHLNEKDVEISKLMVDIWYKFVSSDIPTIDGTDGGTAWPKFTPNEKSYFLHIDSTQPKIIQNPLEKSYTFWNDIFLNRIMTHKLPDTVKTEL